MMTEKRIMGIDYGSVRIGIAVSDPLHIIAQGIAAVRNSDQALREVIGFVQHYDIGLIIVGMPYNLKGEEGQTAAEVNRFIEHLKQLCQTEIITIDERFTSRIAQRTLRDMGTTKKQRRTEKGRVDAMAAALILQQFLDQTKHIKGY
jgi:putative Holliday junction resolvase